MTDTCPVSGSTERIGLPSRSSRGVELVAVYVGKRHHHVSAIRFQGLNDGHQDLRAHVGSHHTSAGIASLPIFAMGMEARMPFETPSPATPSTCGALTALLRAQAELARFVPISA